MKLALVDERISSEEELSLKNLNVKLLKCPISPLLYDSIKGHPDILLHILDKTTLIVHKDMDKQFINSLKSLGFSVLLSKNSLNFKYPKDIMLNALNLPNIFMHKLENTDLSLLNKIKKQHKILLNTTQGYSKCSTAIVSSTAVMTSDKKIAHILTENNIDVLLLPPGDIILPGLEYGFIGGCCGLLDENTLVFYGTLEKYRYKNEVINFLKKHNVNPIYLSNTKLIDRGSIFFLDIPKMICTTNPLNHII